MEPYEAQQTSAVPSPILRTPCPPRSVMGLADMVSGVRYYEIHIRMCLRLTI
jgi:hypothetical protein